MSRDRIQPPYRIEGDAALIELSLDSVAQLFNSLDPAPFLARDLDRDAEEWIVGALTELPEDRRPRLVIHLPAAEAESKQARSLTDAIHNYFAYRASVAARDLRVEFERGRVSLTIGLAFLAACTGLRELLSIVLPDNVFQRGLNEGLLIVGWVAMWRPLEIYLYDWWPHRRRRRLFERLARIDIEVRTA
ncbi:MAG: hypothetical protein KF889_10640 [Alphaproteobacteria bacterium]|nr:hypothetical protein [Alphaproteobacteria bacterium]MCW5741281.1 hypothetical protein [Alphaproteobacteria bacterium]